MIYSNGECSDVSLTMSTVIWPIGVLPCCCLKFLILLCSLGTRSAKTSFKFCTSSRKKGQCLVSESGTDRFNNCLTCIIKDKELFEVQKKKYTKTFDSDSTFQKQGCDLISVSVINIWSLVLAVIIDPGSETMQIHTADALTFLAATTTHAAFWKRKENTDFDERCKAARVNRDFTAEGLLTAARQLTLVTQCKTCQLPRQCFFFGLKLQSFLLQYVLLDQMLSTGSEVKSPENSLHLQWYRAYNM